MSKTITLEDKQWELLLEILDKVAINDVEKIIEERFERFEDFAYVYRRIKEALKPSEKLAEKSLLETGAVLMTKEHKQYSWSEEGIILDLRKLLQIHTYELVGEKIEEPLDYIHRELMAYTERRGKPPEAFFIPFPAKNVTVFGVPIRSIEGVNWQDVWKQRGEAAKKQKPPHYY